MKQRNRRQCKMIERCSGNTSYVRFDVDDFSMECFAVWPVISGCRSGSIITSAPMYVQDSLHPDARVLTQKLQKHPWQKDCFFQVRYTKSCYFLNRTFSTRDVYRYPCMSWLLLCDDLIMFVFLVTLFEMVTFTGSLAVVFFTVVDSFIGILDKDKFLVRIFIKRHNKDLLNWTELKSTELSWIGNSCFYIGKLTWSVGKVVTSSQCKGPPAASQVSSEQAIASSVHTAENWK